MRVLRPGGVLSSLGVYSGTLSLPTDALAAGLGDHTIITTLCPGGKERMRRLMSVLESGRLDLLCLVTDRSGLHVAHVGDSPTGKRLAIGDGEGDTSGGRMRRNGLGLVLVVHGLAHSAAGTWSATQAPITLATVLWWISLVGFVAAGFGVLWCVPLLHRHARVLTQLAASASIVLIVLAPHPIHVLGIAIDVGLVVAMWRWRPEPPRQGAAVAVVVSAAILSYLSAVIVLRPWHTRWGTSVAERTMVLPGDELVPVAHYRMDHAITIDAPADSVWPWLAQLGQDRGGFYSYAWLERMVGDDVHNADRIHPEWQARAVGDLVRATQPGYLGGVLGSDLGWRITRLDPGRVMVLEGWGAFVVRPLGDGRTRLHVRLRGDGRPTWSALVLAPIGLVVFEPAHFIMERGMLRGIKARAERMMRPADS